jgi:hypothetical protein
MAQLIRHGMVGDFARREDARSALARLQRAGFHPDDVGVIMDDPELARDVGGRSYIRLGLIAGLVVGVLFAATVVAMGGDQMPVTSPGFVIGAAGTIGGLGFIGIVFGRTLVRRSPDAPIFAKAVERGDVLVAVTCAGEDCEHAREMLSEAGASDVREEDSPGPA